MYTLSVCAEVWPSHTTNAEPISPLVTSVEAPYYALHPPLPVPKAVLSSWSMVVICPLKDTGATGIPGWYDNRLVVPGASHYIRGHRTIYVREYRVYTATRASPVCYVLISRMYEYSYFHTRYQVFCCVPCTWDRIYTSYGYVS